MLGETSQAQTDKCGVDVLIKRGHRAKGRRGPSAPLCTVELIEGHACSAWHGRSGTQAQRRGRSGSGCGSAVEQLWGSGLVISHRFPSEMKTGEDDCVLGWS